jgi:hypothetical protein
MASQIVCANQFVKAILRVAAAPRTAALPLGGVVATGGGLVATGLINGDLAFFDAYSGAPVASINVGGAIGRGVVTYRAGGRQRLAVAAGHTSKAYGTKRQCHARRAGRAIDAAVAPDAAEAKSPTAAIHAAELVLSSMANAAFAPTARGAAMRARHWGVVVTTRESVARCAACPRLRSIQPSSVSWKRRASA